MGERTIIPFGPQHPVLPEPIHLDLVLEDEKVIEAIPSIGFVHRGLEKLVEKRNFQDYAYVAERICGICSFMHGLGYCMSVESQLDTDIPERAVWLRTFWCELSRAHSHMMWMGLAADAFGFEALFYQCWRIREKILDIFDLTTGGRVIFSVVKIGGIRRDVSEENVKYIKEKIQEVKEETIQISKTFFNDSTVISRLKGVGILSYDDAIKFGACGPMARASGINWDTRFLNYCAYEHLNFKPVVGEGGDSYARCWVRANEVVQACDLILEVMDKLPSGAVDVKVPPSVKPKGEAYARLEQPRGEVIYYTHGNGSEFLDRMRVRTPTFANLPSLLKIVEGASLSDIPTLIVTLDPCISCTER